MSRKNVRRHHGGSKAKLEESSNQRQVKAKASTVPVHFKNTVETARPLRGMTVPKANAYLKDVLDHKECVAFHKFNGGIGKCAQAKQFKCVVGRWPDKSVKVLQDLLRNAISNCEYFGKDPQDFIIKSIQVNQAPIRHRRTFRAHGRITSYLRHMSHIQMTLAEKEE
ncbi:60S ribosomal protein L17-like [Aethina tumida]|uniref:60S ribosomal protein L17-like n=1 Tax=Aethina tumida TaxID=116153 RepID=UPI00096B41ED|nr:60S ribosomal protein L17-like [Aethina tumida]